MTVNKLRRLPLAAAAMLACMGAQAGYQSPDGNFSLSGFGTIGFAKSSTNDVQFNYPGQGGGVGTTPGATTDSKLAVQSTYKFTPTISATAQLMTRFDADSSYVPTLDWVFAKWQIAPGLNVRGGRMGTPYFMVSDFRNVGYANTPVRPNLDVYGQVPTDQFEGADISYQYSLGSTTLNGTFFAGDAKQKFSSGKHKGALVIDPSSFVLKNARGLNLTAEMDNGLTLRAGYARSKMTLQSGTEDALLASAAALSAVPSGAFGGLGVHLNNVGAQGTSAASAVAVRDSKITFTGFGATYDQDDWIISGEYTKRRGSSFIADTTGWYTNVGYRVGKFTPYVGFSKLTVNSANVTQTQIVPIATGGGLDAFTGAVAASLNGSIKTPLDVEKLDQRTITLGSRWDVTSSTALKFQWDQVHKPADSWGLFYAVDPSTTAAQSFLNSRRKVNVLSLSMDVVF